MADLSITPSEVQAGTGAVVGRYIAAASVVAGQQCYIDENGQADLGDAILEVSAQCKGIALNSAASGQPISLQMSGEIDLGSTADVLSGVVYAVSATSGGIAPVADLASSQYLTSLGVGTVDKKIRLGITVGGPLS